MGRGHDHNHTLLARSELIPRDHVLSNRATVECKNQGSNSKVHEKHPIDCLEAHIIICAQSSIREEIARKVTESWTKGTEQNYQWLFEQWCSFCHKRGLPVLQICEHNLVEYNDYLHDSWLCLHDSVCIPVSCVVYSSLQNRQGPQQHPWSNNSLKGCSERSHQPESGLIPGM